MATVRKNEPVPEYPQSPGGRGWGARRFFGGGLSPKVSKQKRRQSTSTAGTATSSSYSGSSRRLLTRDKDRNKVKEKDLANQPKERRRFGGKRAASVPSVTTPRTRVSSRSPMRRTPSTPIRNRKDSGSSSSSQPTAQPAKAPMPPKSPSPNERRSLKVKNPSRPPDLSHPTTPRRPSNHSSASGKATSQPSARANSNGRTRASPSSQQASPHHQQRSFPQQQHLQPQQQLPPPPLTSNSSTSSPSPVIARTDKSMPNYFHPHAHQQPLQQQHQHPQQHQQQQQQHPQYPYQYHHHPPHPHPYPHHQSSSALLLPRHQQQPLQTFNSLRHVSPSQRHRSPRRAVTPNATMMTQASRPLVEQQPRKRPVTPGGSLMMGRETPIPKLAPPRERPASPRKLPRPQSTPPYLRTEDNNTSLFNRKPAARGGSDSGIQKDSELEDFFGSSDVDFEAFVEKSSSAKKRGNQSRKKSIVVVEDLIPGDKTPLALEDEKRHDSLEMLFNGSEELDFASFLKQQDKLNVSKKSESSGIESGLDDSNGKKKKDKKKKKEKKRETSKAAHTPERTKAVVSEGTKAVTPKDKEVAPLEGSKAVESGDPKAATAAAAAEVTEAASGKTKVHPEEGKAEEQEAPKTEEEKKSDESKDAFASLLTPSLPKFRDEDEEVDEEFLWASSGTIGRTSDTPLPSLQIKHREERKKTQVPDTPSTTTTTMASSGTEVVPKVSVPDLFPKDGNHAVVPSPPTQKVPVDEVDEDLDWMTNPPRSNQINEPIEDDAPQPDKPPTPVKIIPNQPGLEYPKPKRPNKPSPTPGKESKTKSSSGPPKQTSSGSQQSIEEVVQQGPAQALRAYLQAHGQNELDARETAKAFEKFLKERRKQELQLLAYRMEDEGDGGDDDDDDGAADGGGDKKDRAEHKDNCVIDNGTFLLKEKEIIIDFMQENGLDESTLGGTFQDTHWENGTFMSFPEKLPPPPQFPQYREPPHPANIDPRLARNYSYGGYVDPRYSHGYSYSHSSHPYHPPYRNPYVEYRPPPYYQQQQPPYPYYPPPPGHHQQYPSPGYLTPVPSTSNHSDQSQSNSLAGSVGRMGAQTPATMAGMLPPPDPSVVSAPRQRPITPSAHNLSAYPPSQSPYPPYPQPPPPYQAGMPPVTDSTRGRGTRWY